MYTFLSFEQWKNDQFNKKCVYYFDTKCVPKLENIDCKLCYEEEINRRHRNRKNVVKKLKFKRSKKKNEKYMDI